MTVLKFTGMGGGGASGLIEAGIKMFEDTDWNEEGATTEEGIMGTLLDMLIWGDSEGQKEMFVSPEFKA